MSTSLFHWLTFILGYRVVPGFATDCACGVWCRGLTTCLLYVGPLFKISFKRQLVSKCDIMETLVFIIFNSLYAHIYVYVYVYMIIPCFCLPYFQVSNGTLFLPGTTVLFLSINVVLTLSTSVVSLGGRVVSTTRTSQVVIIKTPFLLF